MSKRGFLDHPQMTRTYAQLKSFNYIKFAAYRVACKLRSIQKATNIHCVDLRTIRDYFEVRNLGVNADLDHVLTVSELGVLLKDIFVFQTRRKGNLQADPHTAAELIVDWLLNVCNSSFSDTISLLSVKVALTIMVFGSVPAKYHYLFSQLKSQQGTLDRFTLSKLLTSCLLIPKQLGEEDSFSESKVDASVQQCLDKSATPELVSVDDFMEWMMAESQILVWIPTLHRVSVAETSKHEAKCNICKVFPIVGFRYKCLKCFNIDLCQECFWTCRVLKRHKISHPIQEYCQGSTQGEDVKDVARIIKNKMVRGGKSKYTSSKDRFLPVSTEGKEAKDAKDIDSKEFDYSVSEYTSEYGEPPEEAKMNQTRQGSKKSSTSSTRPISKRSSIASSERASSYLNEYLRPYHQDENKKEDESQPKMRPDQRNELEKIVMTLERDNRILEDQIAQMQRQQIEYHSKTSLTEIKSLRNDKRTLEARQEILEDHNRQLEMQLHKLRMLLQQIPLKSKDSSPVHEGSTQFDRSRGVAVVVAPTKLFDPKDVVVATQNVASVHPKVWESPATSKPIFKSPSTGFGIWSKKEVQKRSPKHSYRDLSISKYEVRELEDTLETALNGFPGRGGSLVNPNRALLETAEELSQTIEGVIYDDII